MKYLLAYIISSNPVNTLNSYELDDLSGNEAYTLSNSVTAGYSDITSIPNIQTYGFDDTPYDYKAVRDTLKSFVADLGLALSLSTETDPSTLTPNTGDKHLVGASGVGDFVGQDGLIATYNGATWDFTKAVEEGFDTLSTPDKIICCEHNVGSHDQRKAVVGITNQILYGTLYHKNVVETRTIRMGYAVSEIHDRLPDNNVQIMQEVVPLGLDSAYVKFGVQGTVEDGTTVEGIMDYAYSRGTWLLPGSTLNTPPGSPTPGDRHIVDTVPTGVWVGHIGEIAIWNGLDWVFVSKGLVDKGWTPDSMTNMVELADKITTILVEGIY